MENIPFPAQSGMVMVSDHIVAKYWNADSLHSIKATSVQFCVTAPGKRVTNMHRSDRSLALTLPVLQITLCAFYPGKELEVFF